MELIIALSLVIITLIYNFYVLYVTNSLKKYKVNRKLDLLYTEAKSKLSESTNEVIPLELIFGNINIYQSNYDLKKKCVFIPNGLLKKDDLLSAYVLLHEMGHYIQDYEGISLTKRYKKYASLKYLNFISILGAVVVIVRFEHMTNIEVLLSSIILGIILTISSIFNLVIVNKLELFANEYSSKICSKVSNDDEKMKSVMICHKIRDFLNVLILPIVFILILVHIFNEVI